MVMTGRMPHSAGDGLGRRLDGLVKEANRGYPSKASEEGQRAACSGGPTDAGVIGRSLQAIAMCERLGARFRAGVGHMMQLLRLRASGEGEGGASRGPYPSV